MVARVGVGGRAWRSSGVRLAATLLMAVFPLGAEFIEVEVTFDDTGCASCIASLEGRLGRVRGVDRVEIDAERGVATLHLAPGNRVRLMPLLSRITQDGTKILRTEVEAKGKITMTEQGQVFQPSGLKQTYHFELMEWVSTIVIDYDPTYIIRGVVTQIAPGSQATLTARSIAKATATK